MGELAMGELATGADGIGAGGASIAADRWVASSWFVTAANPAMVFAAGGLRSAAARWPEPLGSAGVPWLPGCGCRPGRIAAVRVVTAARTAAPHSAQNRVPSGVGWPQCTQRRSVILPSSAIVALGRLPRSPARMSITLPAAIRVFFPSTR